jgi:hypothetical protein
VGLEKQGAAFGAGTANPAVNMRESDTRVADASRIAECSASYARYTRMMKVNSNGFRVAPSVEHPDDVESFVTWDRSRQPVAGSPSRRYAAPNVAMLRTDRAQSRQDNVDDASVGYRGNNGRDSENRRLGDYDRRTPSLYDSGAREAGRRFENNCSPESHERQTDRRAVERKHDLTHEATFRPISRTSSRCDSPNDVMVDGGRGNYSYGRKRCVERDDRHFDRPWRGDVVLSPRRYGSCRDALPDEWGHVSRERSGGRRRQSISGDSLSPRRDYRAAHFSRNAFDANRPTIKFISDDQPVTGCRYRRDCGSPYDDPYEQRCDRPSTFDSQRAPSKWMKPPTFNGQTNLDEFLIKFRTVAEYNRWDSVDKIAHLKCALTGAASQLLWDAPGADKLTFDRLVSKLIDRFGSADQRELYITQLRTRRRRQNESLPELYSDIKRLMVSAYAGSVNSEMGGIIARDYFVSALADPELEMKVREREPADLEQALKAALRAEVYLRAYNNDRVGEGRNRRDRKDDRRVEVHYNYAMRRAEQLPELVTQLKRELVELRKELDDANKERDKFRLLAEQRRIDNVASDRPNASPSTFARPTGGRWENALRERRCFYCNHPGHFKRECPRLVDARNKAAQQSSDDGRFCADDVDSNQNADDTDVKCLDDAHCAVVRNIRQSGGQLEQPFVRTAVELGQLQRADADIAPLINAMERGENPPKWNEVADWSAASKSLWRQWRRLQMREGVLHRRFESSDARRISWQIVLPRSERKLFMQLIHAGIGGGHLGRRRTMLAIQARAYWPSWHTDARIAVSCCERCARYRRGKPPRLTPLKPLQAGDVWETVAMDIVGPLPVSREGRRPVRYDDYV